MTLSSETRQAAETLGRALRATDAVRKYLQSQARLEADVEARSLDSRVGALYEDLLARHQAGEELSRDEVAKFYALRGQARSHPLLAGRDSARIQLTRYLADVALDLSVQLGADYTTMATAGGEAARGATRPCSKPAA